MGTGDRPLARWSAGSTWPTPSARRPPPSPPGCRCRRRRGRAVGADGRPRPHGAGRRRPALRRGRRLRPHARRAGAGPAGRRGGLVERRTAPWSCSAAAVTATGPSGRSWARWPPELADELCGHVRQPPLGGPDAITERGGRPASRPATRPRSSSSTAGPPSGWPCRRPGRATWSSSPGRATRRARRPWASPSPSTTGSSPGRSGPARLPTRTVACCLTLEEIAVRPAAGPRRRSARHAVGLGVDRHPHAWRPAPCSWPCGPSATGTTSWPAALDAGAAAVLVEPAARRAARRHRPWSRSLDTAVALAALGRATPGPARRHVPVVGHHRLDGQDVHQGPDRRRPRRPLSAPGQPRLVQQRARRAAHPAGRPPTTPPAPWSWRWVPRGRATSPPLCAVARPTVGVVTNIGTAHAEFFGSRADIARAKGELVEALPAAGTAVLNADDDMTPDWPPARPPPVLTAGAAAGRRRADQRTSASTASCGRRSTSTPPGARPTSGACRCGVPTRPCNAALAVAMAGALGVAPTWRPPGWPAPSGPAWRMELTRTPAGLVVLNDAYNANPASMAAALEALAAPGRARPALRRPRPHGRARAGPRRRAHHRSASRRRPAGLDGAHRRRHRGGAADRPMAGGARRPGAEVITRRHRRGRPGRARRPGSSPATPSWSRPAASPAWSGRRRCARELGRSHPVIALLLAAATVLVISLVGTPAPHPDSSRPEGHRPAHPR